MTVLAKPNSPYVYWDSWRRSRESATRPVRTIYSVSLSILPVCVSLLMIYGVWSVLYSDPGDLLNRLADLDRPAVTQPGTETQKTTITGASINSHLSTTKLEAVLGRARIWFWIVVLLHTVPLYFIYINAVPTYRRWNRIHQHKQSDSLFAELSAYSAQSEDRSKSIQLYDKATGRLLGPITTQQLDFLIEQLEDALAIVITICIETR